MSKRIGTSTEGKVPKHVKKMFGSARAFKRKKRDQINKIRKLVNEFRIGCAFIPGGEECCNQLAKALAYAKELTSVQQWGD